MRAKTGIVAGIVLVVIMAGLAISSDLPDDNFQSINQESESLQETEPVSEPLSKSPSESSVPEITEQKKMSDFPCLGTKLCISGKVDRVVDGDTLYVDGYNVRLSLTNTPERNEPGFSEATEFTKRLCPVGSNAIVDQDDKQPYDVYDRLLGKVYCNGKALNSELLYNGHANISTAYCSTSEFSVEQWAQQFGCGVKQDYTSPTKETSKTTSQENCDSSYPDVCISPYPPDLDCGEISHRNFKVLQPDPHRFDGNKDGIGCES